MDTLSGEATLSNLFDLPSEKGSVREGKTILPSKFVPFRIDYFQMKLVCRKTNRKSQKLLFLYKEVRKLSGTTLVQKRGNLVLSSIASRPKVTGIDPRRRQGSFGVRNTKWLLEALYSETRMRLECPRKSMAVYKGRKKK